MDRNGSYMKKKVTNQSTDFLVTFFKTTSPFPGISFAEVIRFYKRPLRRSFQVATWI